LPLAVLVAGCGSQSIADSAWAERLAVADSIVRTWVDDGRVPGAVLSVAKDGGPPHTTAYGWAQLYGYGGDSLNAPVPMTTTTAFDLASVTKVMATTMAVMLLIDRGALDLDAPVHEYLSDFRGAGKDRVTLTHLLTHRAGLAQWQPVYYHAGDPDAAYAYVRDLPLSWSVGNERHYSDLGFMLLRRIVEQVSGVSLDRFLTEELYEPLGLQVTRFGADAPVAATSQGNPFEHRMVHDTTFGYRYYGDPDSWDDWRLRTLVGEVNDGNAHHAFGGVAGHAGLFSNAADLQVLLQMLVDGGEVDGRRVLQESTVTRFLTPVVEGQALGWQVPTGTPPGSFAHTGFTGTWVFGVPAEGLTVVLLTNRQNGGVGADGRYVDVGALQEGVMAALLSGV